jgi:hypothetical protein
VGLGFNYEEFLVEEKKSNRYFSKKSQVLKRKNYMDKGYRLEKHETVYLDE